MGGNLRSIIALAIVSEDGDDRGEKYEEVKALDGNRRIESLHRSNLCVKDHAVCFFSMAHEQTI